MAFAGRSDKKENITAAIAANIWVSNEKGAKTALGDESLQFIVLDCSVRICACVCVCVCVCTNVCVCVRMCVFMYSPVLTSIQINFVFVCDTGRQGGDQTGSEPSPVHVRAEDSWTGIAQSQGDHVPHTHTHTHTHIYTHTHTHTHTQVEVLAGYLEGPLTQIATPS